MRAAQSSKIYRRMLVNQLIQRMIGAAKLDVQTYETVEHDTAATGQAAAVVVLSALAAGIGSLGEAGFGGLIFGTLAALIGWALWAGIIYLVGAKFLAEDQTEADMGQVLRTLGFAQSPGLIRVFAFIPGIGPLLYLVAAIWMLIAMVVAVRQALDYESTGRAVAVVVLGFVAYVLVFAAVIAMMGGGPAN